MLRRTRKRKKKKSSGVARFLLGIFLLGLVAAIGAGWLVLTPYGPETETFVEVAPGSTTAAIGRQLEASGVVRSQVAFDLLRFLMRGKLRAGEYRFDHPAPATEVYARIARGDVFTVTLTIPEGANIFDIAARVERDGFGTRQEFLNAAVDEAGLVADLDPGAKSLEGYLFPDTYRFARKTKPAQIAAAMVRRFRVEAGQLGLKENVHKVVTIASLVERETAVEGERPLVASVFENRLRQNMPLMTDPSVIYGLELDGRWQGTLGKGGLGYKTPYNTYLHAGLPPGPVANPGVRSLRAAMHPAETDYLYFVAAGADAQGRSLFSSTLEEHNQQVAEYRHAMKKAGER
ncbi:MAG TPA: endolytic transglycosylase MltG [Terracidiphilus sp.]|nr:endolytic transglycosylase MltG [Terracidiphilus sp.]